MKSNRGIPFKSMYVYKAGLATTMSDTIEDFCRDWKTMQYENFELWVDDDSPTYPTTPYMVTKLYLNMYAQPTYIEFTERG